MGLIIIIIIIITTIIIILIIIVYLAQTSIWIYSVVFHNNYVKSTYFLYTTYEPIHNKANNCLFKTS